MTDGNDAPDAPVDWDAFWREASESARDTARPGRFDKPDQFRRFFASRGVPATVGSVGCGPADAEFELARRHPGVEFCCYDAAESVVAENRERVTEEGLDNISFGVATLPDPDIDRRFDLVYCYATLTYVRDSERAIRNLYALVASGGHLVFDYPNRHTRATYRELLPEEVPDEGRFTERWRLVLDGENLLAHERIRDALGTWPRSFYAEVDREDPPRHSPCVFVPK
jgi:SAM-dependent methyltransferase